MTEPGPSGTYHWVPNREVPEWAARGWIVSDARPSHHNRYSTLMELPAARRVHRSTIEHWRDRGYVVMRDRPGAFVVVGRPEEIPPPRRSRLWTWAAILAAGGMIALALEAAFG